MRHHGRRPIMTAAAALLLSRMSPARAETWPARPVTVIVPFPAGSATDAITRVLCKEMALTLGQSFIIQNKPGAGGIIAAQQVAHSKPDGYTVLLGSNTQFSGNVSLYKKLPYDPLTDFAPVGRFTTQPTVLLVRADSSAHTLPDLVAAARASPQKLSAGYGSASTQVVIAKLRSVAGIDLVDVPYSGVPPAIIDVIGGVIDIAVADLGNGIIQAKGGNVRAIAVTSASRSTLEPAWPAVSETYPPFEVVGWHAIAAPAGTPRSVADILYAAGVQALAKQEVIDSLASLGVTPAPIGPGDFGSFLKSDIAYWADLIRAAGIPPQ